MEQICKQTDSSTGMMLWSDWMTWKHSNIISSSIFYGAHSLWAIKACQLSFVNIFAKY